MCYRKYRSVFLLLLLVILSTVGYSADTELFPSYYYREGVPVADYGQWKLENAIKGSQKGNVFELVANGVNGGWRSGTIDLKSRTLYHFKTKIAAKNEDAKGCLPIGLSFQNRDCSGITAAQKPTKEYDTISFVPDTQSGIYHTCLRLSNWEANGTFLFADPQITPVIPIYSIIKNKAGHSNYYLPLGEDEIVQPNRYCFLGFGNEAHGNFSRPLFSTTCSFNTNRWGVGGTNNVVYRFQLQPICLDENNTIGKPERIHFTGGEISINVGYYTSGRCILEAGVDGENWKKLGSVEQSGSITGRLNPEDFGRKNGIADLWIRFRSEDIDGKYGSFQVGSMKVDLTTDCADYAGNGKTVFADIDNNESKQKNVETGPFFLTSGGLFIYGVRNTDKTKSLSWKPSVTIASTDANLLPEDQIVKQEAVVHPVEIPADSIKYLQQTFSFKGGKKYIVRNEFEKTYTWIFSIPEALVQCFTRQIQGMTGTTENNLSISWCEPEYKVIRNVQNPTFLPPEPIKIESAKNDYESFQIVLRPDDKATSGLSDIKAHVSDLVDASGNKIDASKIQIRYAYYHFVEHPTDKTSISAYWPDALVPLKKGADGLGAPIKVAPGNSLPLWITVHVDSSVKSGSYHGKVFLEDGSGVMKVIVPWTLTVWDITLPEKNTLSTAYGISEDYIYKYHNCKTDEQRRTVFELYLKCFGEHRISPYRPAPFDGYRVKWRPDTNPPSAELDFTRFDKEMRRVFDKYHFTNYRLQVAGMGGGTYEGKSAGKIEKYTDNTPEYQAMFADYIKKLQDHLKEVGLLDAAYCYWFDEPEPKDYEFVANGFARLKKYAPGINRMLTEEPNQKICDVLDQKNAQLNIWCPVSYNFMPEMSKKRMDLGEKFWWYVCCGPKAPYCTLFIDHAGTELRIWHWQSFERGITGTLVWTSTWWTSPTAFPDKCQNPYLDPMGYVSSGSMAKGTKNFWGNGDGRFIYPPLRAAEPGLNNGEFILDEPNSSIRWETIREGVEDYELLVILSELAKKCEKKMTRQQKEQLTQIFDFSTITTTLTNFTKVPKPIYEKRRAVADMIMKLKSLSIQP